MKKDQIDEILRGKLHDMEPVGGAPSWGKIEPKLRRKPVRKAWYYSASGAAVAAAVALFVCLNIPQAEINDPQIDVQTVAKAPSSNKSTENPSIPEKTFGEKQAYPSVSKQIRLLTAKDEKKVTPLIDEKDDKIEPSEINEAIQIPEHKQAQTHVLAPQPEQPTRETPRETRQTPHRPERKKETKTISIDDIKSSKERQLAVMTFANIPGQVSSPNSSGQINYMQNSISPGYVFLQTANSRQMINFNNEDLTHKFPMTIGVGVCVPIVGKLSLESGVNYTYLESTAQTTSGYTFKYIQSVHYLGVPVSMTYKLLNTKSLDVYVSAGGMGEYAISSTGKTEIFNGDSFISSDTKDVCANGLQFSVNGAVGMNLHLTKNLGLYVEPGVTHFFKNSSQPTTSRSQADINFNLRAGFKIQF